MADCYTCENVISSKCLVCDDFEHYKKYKDEVRQGQKIAMMDSLGELIKESLEESEGIV